MRPARVRLTSGRSIVELPVTAIRLLGHRWPVAGGGYHRLLPWLLIRAAISRTMRAGNPFVGYCHPYEFDTTEFASLKHIVPLRTRLHQGFGRAGFRGKFERILETFEIVQASEIALGSNWLDHTVEVS